MCERSWERQQRKWRRQTVTKWENDRRQKPDVSDAGTLSTPGGSRCRSASTASRAVAGCDQQQDDTQEFSCSGGINLASTRAKKKRTALLITFDLLLILCCWWWTAASSVLKPPLPSHRSYFVMTLHPVKFFSPPAIGKHHVKEHLFLYSASHNFFKTNIHDTYSSWLQLPAGLTAPRAQSLPVVTKLGLFIIPHNKRRRGNVRTPLNEAQD